MSVNDYFENKNIWKKSRVLSNKKETDRLLVTSKMLPLDVESLIDIGAGNGAFLSLLEKNREELKLKGVERAASARDNKICLSSIVDGDASLLDEPDNSFDVVTSLEVIEHIPYFQYKKVLSELERVCSKYIIISVPYNELRVYATCPECSCRFNPVYHLRSYKNSDMAGLFEDFDLIDYSYVYIKSIWLSRFLRFLNYTFRIRWQRHLLCPQCGYTDYDGKEEKIESNTSNRSSFVNVIKKFIPKAKHPYWIVGLYKKNNG